MSRDEPEIPKRRTSARLQDLRRASEIIQILVAHGFGYLLSKPTLASVDIEDGQPAADVQGLPAPERLRRALEALGPTFVKLGQVLSTRADIVPQSFADALQSLQDQAAPLPFETIRKVVERELKKPLDELFASFEVEPLATASIAQVHRATIQRDGHTVEVVCKVQRPGVRRKMRSDLSLLFWLARVLEDTVEEVSSYSPTSIVEQFEQAVSEEIDFINERKNMERAWQSFASRPELLVVPEPIIELSTSRVLTMTFLDGVKITDVKGDSRYDMAALRTRLVEAAFKQVFEDGFFHGDPHPGNVFVLQDGRLGLLDHGLWGHLTSEQQDALVQWLTAVALKSPATFTRLTTRVGEIPPGFDRKAYERDIRQLMDRYIGVELSELSSSSIFVDSTDVIRKHRIKLPADFGILARATATLEGIIRRLYPDLDFQAVILPYVQRLLLQRFDLTKAGPEAMTLVLGLQAFVSEVPSQINQLLDDLSTGRFQVGLKGEALENLAWVGRIHSVRVILAVLFGAFVIATAISLAPLTAEYSLLKVGLPVAAVLSTLAVFGGLVLTFLFPRGLRKIRVSRWLFWRRRRRR